MFVSLLVFYRNSGRSTIVFFIITLAERSLSHAESVGGLWQAKYVAKMRREEERKAVEKIGE